MRTRTIAALAAQLAAVVALIGTLVTLVAGCAHGPSAGAGAMPTAPPAVDSATVALWRFDETTNDVCRDAGPSRLDGTPGFDTRSDFGRFHQARVFTRSIQSFVYVAPTPELELPDAITVEAWVRPDSLGAYEDTPIAGRWTQETLGRSWLLSIVGHRTTFPRPVVPSPGYHDELVGVAGAGQLLFAIQPDAAGAPLAFVSTSVLPVGRWSHVAASFDGQVVRLFVDGRLDAQYEIHARIRPSNAPILIGNSFDSRWLTAFQGRLQLGSSADPNPYYAFVGLIDELRISSVARTRFDRAP